MTRVMLALSLFLVCAACTHPVGHDFPTADTAGLIVGVTTKSEVQARFGAPTGVNTETRSSAGTKPATEFDLLQPVGEYSTLDYRYSVIGSRLAGGLGTKAVRLIFFDNRLASYAYVDNFANASTNFDEARLGQIVKGVTRKEEVIALLGYPSGKWGPPLIQEPNGEAYNYLFWANTIAGDQKATKNLMIIFDASGRVKNYRLHTQVG